MKYRAVPHEDGFKLQYRKWFIWWDAYRMQNPETLCYPELATFKTWEEVVAYLDYLSNPKG